MEKNLRKVSVLVPTFRPGNYLVDCLQSIENQTLDRKLFKVYIGLNGDFEPYYKFVENALVCAGFEYELFYIEKSGVSNARNFLIEQSQEEYIVFVDDDDLLSPNYLEELLRVSSSDAMGIANVYNFEETIGEKKTNYIGMAFQAIVDGESSKFKARKYFSSPWAKMLHRGMIAHHLFDPRVAKGEDSLFMAMLSPHVKCVRKTSDDACYFVRERIGSVTRRKTPLRSEIKTLSYLMLKYFRLLSCSCYDKSFIITRLIATALKFFKMT
ncbi:glycosyltransferase family 2 protein [Halomonas alkalicola]|uniref:Glycosyltransferase family A protein n=1 Tax=Halomonas alkalicola TaxID=1930622 RepID=A0ABY9H5I3_9GAMM|nr:glycosyltransferase family A protein [Halomonas alkalicola]WLI73742.1 glycosyltransferase family A protein [Halomonas alkalicola]